MARRRSVSVVGVLLTVEGRFVCWDSFAAAWFLGPRRLSEVFSWGWDWQNGKRIREALAWYPSSGMRFEE